MSQNKKSWFLLNIFADNNTREILSAFLNDGCLGSLETKDHSEFYFEPHQRQEKELILEKYSDQYELKWSWEQIKQEAWHLAWQDRFKPIVIDEDLIIVPEWDTETKAKTLIRIRPGMAFGTGHHATTKLMLKAIKEYLEKGMKVLDVGTGSGILAITCKNLGSDLVQCVEFDVDCEDNFHDNLKLNGIQSGVTLNISDILNWSDFSHDIILANVNRSAIMDMIPNLRNANGLIIFSGLLITDEEIITRQCKKYRLTVINKMSENEWICLIAKKM